MVRHSIFALLTLALVLPMQAQPPTNPLTPKLSTGSGSSTTREGGGVSIQQSVIRAQQNGGGFSPANGGGGSDATAGSGSAKKTTGLSPEVLVYASSITPSDLHAHLSFLASDELEGRETATHGQKIAARYLAAQFQKMGLQPGNEGKWYQVFELERVTVRDVALTFDGKTELKKYDDFIYVNKFAFTAPLEAPLAFAGFGISDNRYDNLDKLNLKGKVAVILNGEPMRDGKSVLSGTETPSEWASNPDKKAEVLAKAGAVAIVSVVPEDQYSKRNNTAWTKHRMEGTGLRLAYQKGEGEIPYLVMPERIFEAYFKKSGFTGESLRKTLDGKQEVPEIAFKKAMMSMKPDVSLEKIESENVLGYLEGTDKKDEVIVLTAHYDHLGIKEGQIHYGADDDGSGTAAILEIAEAFSEAAKNGYRPRRSILFMPVSGEEKGLLGSEFYSDHPVFPLKKTVCNLNIDMIGRLDEAHEKDSNYVYIIGSDKLSYDLHRANEMANQFVTKIDLDYRFNDPKDPNQFYYRSDHYNFAKNGIPVIFYFSGVHPDYHKPTDTIDKIMFGKVSIITRLVFATAWEVANREERLVVDRKNDFQER